MGWTKVQRVTTQWFLNGTSPTLTISSTTAGNLLVLALATPQNGNHSYTLPSGWSTPVNEPSASQNDTQMAYYLNNPGGITSVQIQGVVNTTYTDICVWEFSFTGGTAAFDNSGVNTGTGTAGSASITLGHGTELICAAMSYSANDTGAPTYTSGFNGTDLPGSSSGTGYFEENLATSSGSLSITPSTGGSQQWSMVGMAFYIIAPAGKTQTPTIASIPWHPSI